jgi:hypothetical protein
MRRWLLIFASLVSALLAIALAAAWTRSFLAREKISWSAASRSADRSEWRTRTIMIGRGQFRIDSSQGTNTGSAVRRARLPSPGMKWESQEPYAVYTQIDGPPPALDRFGVVFASNRYELPSWDDKGETRFFGWYLVIPFWLLTGLASVAPAVGLWAALKRWHRRRRGRCVFSRLAPSVVLWVLLFAMSDWSPAAATTNLRPNVLILLIDDAGYTPARACLMTGRYHFRTRAIDTFMGRAMMDPDEVTMAEVFRAAGYRTGIFGKWHLGDNYPMRTIDRGFEVSVVHRDGGLGEGYDRPSSSYFNPLLAHNGKDQAYHGYCKDQAYHGYCNDVFFREAIRLHRKEPGGALLLLSVHQPCP